MKKFFFYLMLLVAVVSSCDNEDDVSNNPGSNIKGGGSSEEWLCDSIYMYGYGTLYQKSIYTYNDKKQETLGITYSFKDGLFSPTYKWESTYNADGLRIITISSSYSNDEWILSSKSETTYTSSKSYYRIYYSYTENGYEPNSKYEYEYDAAGNSLLTGYYLYVDDAWVYQESKTKDEFDAKNRLVGSVSYQLVNGEWQEYSKYVYIYGDDGKLLELYQYYMKNGSWKETSCTMFERDSNGNNAKRVDYLINEDGTKTEMNICKYYWSKH